MATFTSNFSSWTGFEALLSEAQAFESSQTYAEIQSDLVEFQNLVFPPNRIYQPPPPIPASRPSTTLVMAQP